MYKWMGAGLLMMGMTGTGLAQDTAAIKLPPPEMTGGKPLMQALQARRSSREFGSTALPPQVLSNLLWAANGVNRPDSGKRTAPSARDWREIDVYVATAEGVYLYDPPTHTLQRVAAGDIRALTGVQDFVATAPVNLVYVADLDRTSKEDDSEQRARFSAADAGFIAQNVYLFCASAGLATVVRGLFDHAVLAKALGLGSHQRIILAQSVGHPANSGQ
jgi:SagB-type dehydrogenase family enzyme